MGTAFHGHGTKGKIPFVSRGSGPTPASLSATANVNLPCLFHLVPGEWDALEDQGHQAGQGYQVPHQSLEDHEDPTKKNRNGNSVQRHSLKSFYLANTCLFGINLYFYRKIFKQTTSLKICSHLQIRSTNTNHESNT